MGPNVQDAAARAKQLISERKYQDAVRACRRVLLSRPDEASMRVLLAQALLALGRHDEVRVEMQALLKKSPDVGAAHRLLGEALLRGGKKQQAIAALKEALRLDPDDDEARDLLDESGDVVEEMAPLETIERWFPEEPTRVETPDAPSAPATRGLDEGLASIELAPDFEAEVTQTNEHRSPPDKRGTKSTLLGLPPVLPPSALPPAPRSSPNAVPAPPAPSVPPPPPGGGLPSARPPRA
ncbi:MAG: tetratricopeptide repeat protein, partial [Myxococcales bacterium]|nr:tetratricopeptide repeat protein [Myxococcales bacterium]